MRVCLLGGTRFIGRAVAQHLISSGHELLIVHRGHTEPADLPAARHVHVDRAALAAEKEPLTAFDPQAIVDTYAMTAAHASAALTVLDGELPTVVLSSMDVYRAYGSLLADRQTDPVPLTERSPLRPRRYPYRGQPVSGADFDTDQYEKLAVEERYLAADATVLRLGFVYGEHDPQRREEYILRRVRAGRSQIPFGPGNWIVSRTYAADVGPAVEQALARPNARGEVFNICEAQSPTIRLWAQDILSAASSTAELIRVPDEHLPPDLAMTAAQQPLLATPAKAQHLLGWSETDPATALTQSVQWHLANPPADASQDLTADDRALQRAAASTTK
jgi:nucleoside-diphosphate-sugar epimerase